MNFRKKSELFSSFSTWLDQLCNPNAARVQLEGLVFSATEESPLPNTASWNGGLTEPVWKSLNRTGKITDKDQVRGRIYLRGVQPSIRKEVWPYLLEHYKFGSTPKEREQIDLKTQTIYEKTKSEWLSVEDAFQQRQIKVEDLIHSSPKIGMEDASKIKLIDKTELLKSFRLDLIQIDKDVPRCDRNHPYFHQANLAKLRNVVCTYVYNHLDVGYMQGMCDLAAPLLALFDDEALTYACFSRLMDRMSVNFSNADAMTQHYSIMRSLIQILDTEIFELFLQFREDECLSFSFCYRWFLLHFKRELAFEDVYSVWEVIWAARSVSSREFEYFFAMALIHLYRKDILESRMDFTDIHQFFSELSEKHDVKAALDTARFFVVKLQTLLAKK